MGPPEERTTRSAPPPPSLQDHLSQPMSARSESVHVPPPRRPNLEECLSEAPVQLTEITWPMPSSEDRLARVK